MVARSHESLLSPAWSPDGHHLAYVSFESGNSHIYVQDISTGGRQLVEAHAKGINGAPAWSPDGSKLAVSLSFSGNPEIYVLDMASRHETRLTNSLAIDQSAVYWGQFGDRRREGPFPDAVASFAQELTSERFTALTHTAMEELVEFSAKELFATGGFIFFAAYESRGLDYLLIDPAGPGQPQGLAAGYRRAAGDQG